MRAIFFFSIFMSMLGCSKDPNVTPLEKPTNPKLKFFGFSLVDVFFDDPTDDDSKTNYSSEVAPFSNIADILVVDPEQSIVENLEIMDGFQMKAYLHLNELIFEVKSEGGEKSGVIYGLRDDYTDRWLRFAEVNDLAANGQYVEALYIGEEPFWNGISGPEFQEACDFLKGVMPSTKLMMVEAYAAVDEMEIPESVDWVGFDHYFIKDPSTDEDFLREMEVIESKMAAHQDIILVLDSHFLPVFHNLGGITKNNLDEVARNYYRLANDNSRVVGMIGYFWPSGFDFEIATGARGLPEHVKNEYERIGRAITGK